MKSAIYMEGKRFAEVSFDKEDEFEKVVRDNCKTLFGPKTIYFNLKKKIETKSLGDSVPDGFLVDFTDQDNPEFYLVEVELEKHDFYKHIFPQITRFFSFFKNETSRNNLIEKLFHYIKGNQELEDEFKKYLGNREIFKALKDVVENSQHILLIIDENKSELQEVFETYTDTWDKKVKVAILKQYADNKRNIFTLSPDFENIDFVEPISRAESEEKYTESFHTEDVEEGIISIYERIKKEIQQIDPDIKINPQKYYISLRKRRNFAFINIKRKKIRIVIMISYEEGKSLIKAHKIRPLTDKVQKFYNGPSFEVTLENQDNFDEILRVLKKAFSKQNN